jgi:hypothetical protein
MLHLIGMWSKITLLRVLKEVGDKCVVAWFTLEYAISNNLQHIMCSYMSCWIDVVLIKVFIGWPSIFIFSLNFMKTIIFQWFILLFKMWRKFAFSLLARF